MNSNLFKQQTSTIRYRTNNSLRKSNHNSNDSGCYSNSERQSSISETSEFSALRSEDDDHLMRLERLSKLKDSLSDISYTNDLRRAQIVKNQLHHVLSLSSRSTPTATKKTTTAFGDNLSTRSAESTRSRKNLFRSNTLNSSFIIRKKKLFKEQQKETINNDKETKQFLSKAKSLIKTSKKLFNWNTKKSKNENEISSKETNGNSNSEDVNLKLLNNKIAAKLLIENIDLTEYPYTNEVNICYYLI
jgi:hypothetical protein